MAKTALISTTLLLLFSVLILPFFAAADDAQTLLIIKKGLKNPPSLVSWNASNDRHCNWKGVACAPATTNVTALRLTSQDLYGELPETICDLANLTVLDLTNNHISGGFPSVLYRCNQLRSLNLSLNLLVGAIPNDIARFTALRELNLSGNNFTGDIPRGIGRLASIEVLDLQNNLLNGSVPPEIGSPPEAKAHTAFPAVLIHILVEYAIPTLSFVVCAASLVRAYNLRKRESFDYASWKLTAFQKLRFTSVDIRRGLTENHLIGQGGTGKVYQVPIRDSVVAVKRIWNERLFEAEVDILRRIRHSNVVKLLCSISGDDTRLLVYEFMVNGSLARWLHSCDSILDWPSRYRVAVGSARGLHYMHHDCSPPVIHRNVKSSNILLDEELKPKIADFGLARLIGPSDEPESVSVVAGSLGYIAPEYACTVEINEKGDVYTFGVVLLELATGREAHNGGGEMNLVDWARQHFEAEKPLAEAMDQRIHDPSVSDQMFAVFKLGLRCTSKLPADRPPMDEVVDILRRQ